MSLIVPSYEEFESLANRVSALEAGGGGSTPVTGQSIWVERTERGAGRYDSIPATRGSGDIEWRNILELEVKDVRVGEQWLVFAEYHGTSDDVRSRGGGLNVVHELRAGGVGGNDDRDGYRLNEDQGGQNVSVGAHHDYRLVPGFIQWDWPRLSRVGYLTNHPSVFIKFMLHAKGTQAESGDEYKIEKNMSYIYLLRICPS